jgi:hypothetical protein
MPLSHFLSYPAFIVLQNIAQYNRALFNEIVNEEMTSMYSKLCNLQTLDLERMFYYTFTL